MFKLRTLLFIALTALLFAHCKNEKPVAEKQATDTPSVKTASKGFYKHMVGTIDTLAVTMDLIQKLNTDNDYEGYNYQGYYYYNKYQQPIGLYGEVDSSGNIVLLESNWQEKEYNFTGKFDANGNFTGTWRDVAGKKMRTFNLKESYTAGTVQFDSQILEDSVKLWSNAANSPTAYFDMHLLLPDKNTEGGTAAFIKDKIFMGIKNDSIDKSYANLSLENLRNALRDTFFTNYKETLKDEKPEDVGASMNYAESSSMSVLYNEKGILSMGYGTYTYSGGAHGNHATLLTSYDVAQKKALKLKDIFLPGYEKTVDKAVANAVRKLFGMKPNEPLSNKLFENTIQHTDNFCITSKGILFKYNPYEIAAYAYGEIELFVPFEEVKGVVNPRFLQ
jgi:hypothetical protein